MIEKYLFVFGSLIILLLGVAHLVFTFFTNKFSSRNPETESSMKADFPILTRRTTMWKAWVGFNASHSVGAIFFGAINSYLAFNHFSLVIGDVFLVVLNLTVSATYFWLAWKYWFRIPLIGTAATLICYLTAILLAF